tara:strand:- start:18 stop:734 length:717 start_codon:yes stop_codon:yes gene_type:complete
MSKFKTYAIILLLTNLVAPGLFAKETILYGIDIKAQASDFFSRKGIDAEVLISDKRSFFACPEGLEFAPKIQGDWRTIKVYCNGKKWKLILRTNASYSQISNEEDQINTHKNTAIILTKNMSKGEVIEKSDLELVSIEDNYTFAVFSDFNNLIGKKVTTNLSKGTIVKSRHVKYLNKVNKDETVIIVVGNKKISVVTYGLAMSAGQIGDMITVKNIGSNNTFKAIVLDEKKVTPLTNM